MQLKKLIKKLREIISNWGKKKISSKVYRRDISCRLQQLAAYRTPLSQNMGSMHLYSSNSVRGAFNTIVARDNSWVYSESHKHSMRGAFHAVATKDNS